MVKCIKNMAKKPEFGKWIPVREKMPEECREAMEKQKPVAVIEKSMLSPIGANIGRCPVCLEVPLRESNNMYCPCCGGAASINYERTPGENKGFWAQVICSDCHGRSGGTWAKTLMTQRE